MTKHISTFFIFLALLFAGLAFFTAPSYAAAPNFVSSTALVRAQAAGLVGERHDGYVALRRNDVSADVKAIVRTVNRQRKVFFDSFAERAKTNSKRIGQLFAIRLLKKAPPGHWFYTDQGQWYRKFP